MKTYPARFIGEFDRNDPALEKEPFETAIPNIGDVALVTGYPDGAKRVWIRCACGHVDPIPVEPRPSKPEPTWALTSRNPVNIEPSIRVSFGQVTRCHYFVHGGQLQMLDDTTAPLP